MVMILVQILDESCPDSLASLMPLVGTLPGRSPTLHGYIMALQQLIIETKQSQPSARLQPPTSQLASAAADTAEVHAELQDSMAHARQSAANISTRGHQDPYMLANTM